MHAIQTAVVCYVFNKDLMLNKNSVIYTMNALFCLIMDSFKELVALQKMEILPVNDLGVALQNFVNKEDKMAFYQCVQYNLEETRVSFK